MPARASFSARQRLWILILSLALVLLVSAALAHDVLRATPAPPEFRFLTGRSVLFRADPGVPGVAWFVYTFPGDNARVAASARSELRSAGYRELPLRGGFSSFERGKDIFDPVYASVTVGQGRITGKSFVIDGDFLDNDHDLGWVNVDVVVRDPLPDWLRAAVGTAER